jgi:hypothetical protein
VVVAVNPSSGTDWQQVIQTANQAALAWYVATRTPPVQATQGVVVTSTPGAVTAQASTSILILGAIVILAFVVMRR